MNDEHILTNSSEVNLGLEREEGQSQAKSSCYANGHQHPVDIMVDGN